MSPRNDDSWWSELKSDPFCGQPPHEPAPVSSGGNWCYVCQRNALLHFGRNLPYNLCIIGQGNSAMKVGYARVSTEEQEAGFAVQQRELKALGCQKVFAERLSAVTVERP